jgi:hypothetical protein
LIVFFIFISCSNNTVRDYTSLKQKALEIPPDFELSPPVINDDSASEELPNEEVVEDIEEILTSDNSAKTSEKTESSSSEDFIDSNFVNDEKEEVSNEVKTNEDTESLDGLVNDDLPDQPTDVEKTNDTEEMIQDDQAQNNESQETNFTEEKLLDELSNVDDITSLPEEEQLKPEIIEEEVYDDPTVYDDDQDLNDLLNRVDDLLNSYSN